MRNRIKMIFALISLSLLIVVAASLLLIKKNQTEEVLAEDNSPRIYVSDTTAAAGGEVYIGVNVAHNPGFAGIVLDLAYDEAVLKPLEVLQGALVSNGGLFASNINDDLVKMTWFDVADIAEDGELFAVKFRVLNAEEGTTSPITIHYDNGNIANTAYENVDFNVVNANVIIQ